jgi:hypothetical protein
MVQADSNPITRRNLISGTVASTGAASLPALPVPAAAANGDDARLMRLYEELRDAWSHQRRAEALAADEELPALVEECAAVVHD